MQNGLQLENGAIVAGTIRKASSNFVCGLALSRRRMRPMESQAQDARPEYRADFAKCLSKVTF